MKRFFKRLFCLHLNWVKGRPITSRCYTDYTYILGKGQLIPWTCTECGKTKQFTDNNPPIQYMDH